MTTLAVLLHWSLLLTLLLPTHQQPPPPPTQPPLDCTSLSPAGCTQCAEQPHCVFCNRTTTRPSRCSPYSSSASSCAAPILYVADCGSSNSRVTELACDARGSCDECLSEKLSSAIRCLWCSAVAAAGDGRCVPAREACNQAPFILRADQLAACARFVTTANSDVTAADADSFTADDAPDASSSSGSLIDQPAIIGAAVAALVLILLIVVLVVYLVLRVRRLSATVRSRRDLTAASPAAAGDDALAVRNAAYDSDCQLDHRGLPVRVVSARRIQPPDVYDNPFSTSKEIEPAPPSERLFAAPLPMTTQVLPPPYSFERRLPPAGPTALYDAVPPESTDE